MDDTIKKIVETAKKRIKKSSLLKVDEVAESYVRLLEDMGEEEAAEEIYQFYKDYLK